MAEDQGTNDTGDNPELDDDEGSEGEWTPPTKEEWEKAQRTMAARKRERDEARREAAQLRDGGKGKAEDSDGKPDAGKAAQEASDNRARRAAGITALVEAGLTKAAAKEALPLLKVGKLTVDADGDVDEEDLADAVASMKEKFPGMFPAAGKKGSRQRTADGAGSAGRGSTKSATDRTTDALLRQAGFLRD